MRSNSAWLELTHVEARGMFRVDLMLHSTDNDVGLPLKGTQIPENAPRT
jgi:hypothetical protein